MREGPLLIVLSGLPASGKSSVARIVARERGAAWLRIDTIEQGLRELLGAKVGGEGYRLAYRIAADALRGGVDVVADCVNPWELTRREWRSVAEDLGLRSIEVEVRCSDAAEHRRRAEARDAEVPGMPLPSWADIEARDWEPWKGERILVETAGRSAEDCAAELLARIGEALRRL